MIIPEHYVELERIYNTTLAKNIRSLAVVSTFPGEGVSSIIISLAKRNALAGRTTLLVDLNIHNPQLNSQLKKAAVTTKSTTIKVTDFDQHISVISGPTGRTFILNLRKPGVLAQHIKQWLTRYDNVIIDTSPMSLKNSANLPPEYIVGACDGTLLTVLAGKTTNAAVATTIKKLQLVPALLVGTVINDQFNPTLKHELLRETRRLNKLFPKLAIKLRHWINHNKILALEV